MLHNFVLSCIKHIIYRYTYNIHIIYIYLYIHIRSQFPPSAVLESRACDYESTAGDLRDFFRCVGPAIASRREARVWFKEPKRPGDKHDFSWAAAEECFGVGLETAHCTLTLGGVLGLKSLAACGVFALNSREIRYLHATDRCCEFDDVPAVATA